MRASGRSCLIRVARQTPGTQMLAFDTCHPSTATVTARMRVKMDASDSEAPPQQAETQRTSDNSLAQRLAPPDPPWSHIVGLCTLAILICYADRFNISVAIVPMSLDLHWSESYKGTILSVFFIGYAATQLLGGGLADRFGGVIAWSVFTFLTPEAAMGGTVTLIACRIAMGLGEGIAFPAVHSIIARTVPRARQSTAVAVVTAASYAGAATAAGVSPWIITNASWQSVFYIFGASAVLWLPFWLLTPVPTTETPTEAPPTHVDTTAEDLSSDQDSRTAASAARDEERLLAVSQPDPNASSLPASVQGALRAMGMDAGFIALVQRKEVWAIGVAQYCQSWGLYVLLNWLPTFYTEQYHIDLSNIGEYTVLPPLVQAGVGGLSGVVADHLINRGVGVKRIRRWMQITGMLGPAGCLILAASPVIEDAPAFAAALITVAQGLSALTLAGVSVSQLDIAPRHAGAVFGFGNALATLSGLLGTKLTGEILDFTHSWALVFSVTAGHFVAGSIAWYFWVGDERLPEDELE